MNQGRGRIRYLEVFLILAVVAVLALLLRPQAGRKPEPAGIRQDLMAVIGPVWGARDAALATSCSGDVLNVRLHLSPQTPPRKFWLTQVVGFVCANQPGAPLRPGVLDATDGPLSGGAAVPVTRVAEPVVDADLNMRCNDLIEQTLGPKKGLFLAERFDPEAPVSGLSRGELAIVGPKDKKRAPESDAGEPGLNKGHSEQGRALERDARQPAPYFPKAQQYRSFLVLGASVAISQDENLRGRLARLVSVPAPSITVIHLQSHVAAP